MPLSRRALAIALALAACAPAGPEERVADPVAPVLILGVDGLDWEVLAPLVRAGRCPNVAALMERGSWGRLATLTPTLSPILWTTIATGRLKRDHGIHGFLDEQGRPYTSGRRRVRALWNVADRWGLSSAVIGWWATWPVEPIRGVMVSAASGASGPGATWKPSLLPDAPDQVHPPELEARVLAIAAEAGSRESVERLARETIYGPVPTEKLTEVERLLIEHSNWTLQADETVRRVARALVAERDDDLTLVYLAGPDVVGHRFWRHHRPDEFAWTTDPAVVEALSDVVPNAYVWVDTILGELVAAAGPDTTVMLVSDHGMHAVNRERPDPVTMNTGDHQDGPPGVIVAAGPGIAVQPGFDAWLDGRRGLPLQGSVLAVAPTVLALLGIPAARDLPGRAHRPLLDAAARARADLPPVASHDLGFEPAGAAEVPAAMDAAFKEKFGALGYLELDADAETDSRLVVPDDR